MSTRKRHKGRKRDRAPLRRPAPGAPTDGLLRFLGLKPSRRPLHHKLEPPQTVKFGVQL
jgi:hypothetical protein